MDNTIFQAVVWISAGGLLVMLMSRRRKRKQG
jgi:hypothetical protein